MAERRMVNEAHDDCQEKIKAALLHGLAAGVDVRVCELGMLLSTLEAVTEGAELQEEVAAALNPRRMTTAEAVEVLARFLDMSAAGKERLWDVLDLTYEGED